MKEDDGNAGTRGDLGEDLPGIGGQGLTFIDLTTRVWISAQSQLASLEIYNHESCARPSEDLCQGGLIILQNKQRWLATPCLLRPIERPRRRNFAESRWIAE